MMVLDAVLYAVLAWYLDNVFPGWAPNILYDLLYAVFNPFKGTASLLHQELYQMSPSQDSMALVDHSTSHSNPHTGKVLHRHTQRWLIKVRL